MVVGQHAAFLKDFSNLGWYITVNGLFRIAVPIFLVINGFFFYSVTKSNTKLWFKKIILLYFFWMAFYSYFWLRPTNGEQYNFTEMSLVILLGYHHLWYLPGMIGAAILVFLFRNFHPSLLLVTAIVCFLIGLAIQYIGNYHLIENQLIDKRIHYLWVYRNFLFFSFPFFALGFLINKIGLGRTIISKKLLLVSILGLILLLLESLINFNYLPEYYGFDFFASLLVVCPALFLFFIKVELLGNSKVMAQYSTAIYFIHPFFISVIHKFFGFGATTNTFLVTALSVVAGYFMIKLNSKIKYIL